VRSKSKKIVTDFLVKVHENANFCDTVDIALNKFRFITREYRARQKALKRREKTLMRDLWDQEEAFLLEYFGKKKKDK
jgi:hypothetical protein